MDAILSRLTHEFATPFTNPILVFGLLLFLILVIPIIMKKIKTPEIIGLIIVGIIIGPHGFNIIAQDAAIELLSTIGLMYIMFIVGLELDMKEFKIHKNKSVLFGVFTFIIPMIIGYFACHYLLSYEKNTSLLIASLLATHTLVTYPIVSRMGVAKNRIVPVTVGGTILTDTAVLIILAILLKNSKGALSFWFILELIISLTIFSFFVFFIIPRFAKWFFQKVENEKYLNYIFVLFIVFLSGLLAELGGLEPIIGAFAAGLALNHLIPHTSALMNRIEFIGNSLFIPVFLISVGMLENIRVLFDGTTSIYVAFILSVAAIFSKWIAAFFTQLIFRYSTLERNLIFGLSTARAAATLAVVLVGYKAGILDEYIFNGTIILILVTCIVASFITQSASKKMASSQECKDRLSTSEIGLLAQEKILVPIADPTNIGKHIELALLMKDKKSENPILLLCVLPNNEEVDKNIMLHRKKLNEFIENARATDIHVDTIASIDHNVASGIVRTARETMSDIVILGWPSKVRFLDRIFGEKVDAIIHNLDKNLFVCDIEKPFLLHKRIVLIAHPLSEKESGFSLWINKIKIIAQELSLPILFVGERDTYRAINSKVAVDFYPFDDWEHPFEHAGLIKANDMLLYVSAHRGYISYVSGMDTMPSRMAEYFPHHSKIVIFPRQYHVHHIVETQDDIFTAELPTDIQKHLRKIFIYRKRKKQEKWTKKNVPTII